jgi:signal transduction histidine kinase/CheY-like chemotaxis protein
MRRAITAILGLGVVLLTAWGVVRSGSSTGGVLWGADARCVPAALAAAGWWERMDFFTNFGSYMPRTRCMVTQNGETDWAWVWLLFGLNAVVIAGYLRIFRFWRKAFLAEEHRDRNNKLMDLAWIFLLCACCGYVSSMVLFFWPGYRLLALMLVPLAFFTWRFAWNLESFRLALSAKRLERELRESLMLRNEELERLVAVATEEAIQAKLEAERANEAKSAFLANMSHEIRTPMTAIIGYTDLMLDHPVDEAERREHLETVRRNGRHLLGLINDILDLSKVEAGKFEVESVPCDPIDIVGHVRGLLAPRAAGKGIGLDLTIAPDAPARVMSDPNRLQQVVTNLVGNAVKFTERGGVTVEIGHGPMGPAPAGTLVIRVRDTGIGMTPEQAAKCFRPFAQADASIARKFGGTGLGLAISRRLARQLGGDIAVESEPGVGTTFTLWVDAGEAGLAAPAGMLPGADMELAGPDQRECLRGARVLVAEDGPDNQRLIRFHLERSGAAVTIVENGQLAVDVLTDGRHVGFDLVIMDLQMPVLDGLGAARELRQRGVTVPIVALTASAMGPDSARSIEAGCDAHCTKPLNLDDLFETCGRLIHHRREAA